MSESLVEIIELGQPRLSHITAEGEEVIARSIPPRSFAGTAVHLGVDPADPGWSGSEMDWSDCDPAQLHAKLRSLFHLSRRAVCEAVGFSSTTFNMR